MRKATTALAECQHDRIKYYVQITDQIDLIKQAVMGDCESHMLAQEQVAIKQTTWREMQQIPRMQYGANLEKNIAQNILKYKASKLPK